jgi:hypothetical protein
MSTTHPVPQNNTRIGLNYFPDTLHYREVDLQTWLPLLKSMGVGWLSLHSPINRAVPEMFIKGLLENGIQPILHFRQQLSPPPNKHEIEVLLKSYAAWGVKYIALFDRPNMQSAWSEENWVAQQLVERYLDTFIDYAELVCQLEMYPILSPLEPGGDFWDTAFLRSALQGIKQRGHQRLLSRLVIGAYAWPANRPLDWGSGGPERWPGARPYFTPEGEQDQLGFRVFDWYNILSEAALNTRLPIILLGTGCRLGEQRDPNRPAVSEQQHASQNLNIARLLAGDPGIADKFDPIPENVLAGNFSMLSSDPADPEADQAWFRSSGDTLDVVSALQKWWAGQDKPSPKSIHIPTPAREPAAELDDDPPAKSPKLIDHYLLLPVYEWGISDQHLEIIQPYIKKHAPTIGFSIEEASMAEIVTIIGGEESFPQDVIDRFEQTGCQVRRAAGDGTSIATLLAEL